MDKDTLRIVDTALGFPGVLLAESKRDRSIIYNANVIVGTKKVWFGDFRLVESDKLKYLAIELKSNVYLLEEMDARFETESQPRIDKAVLGFDKNGVRIK